MAPKTAICYFVIAMLFWCAATPTHSSGLLPTGSARAFRWKAARIQVGISSSLLRDNSNITRGSDVEGAVRRSLATWENVANVEFLLVPTEKQNASPAGPAGDGGSVITSAGSAENAQLFTKESEQAAATTRIFYSGRGFITEADIVLNPYQQFST